MSGWGDSNSGGRTGAFFSLGPCDRIGVTVSWSVSRSSFPCNPQPGGWHEVITQRAPPRECGTGTR